MSNDHNLHVARVRAGATLKINIGNYETAGIEASIELPCLVEDVPKEFHRAWAEVYRQLEMKANEIKQGRSQQ